MMGGDGASVLEAGQTLLVLLIDECLRLNVSANPRSSFPLSFSDITYLNIYMLPTDNLY